MRTYRLWFIASFLLLLGVGNILVGVLKGQQYESVVEELSGFESSSQRVHASALSRIQIAKNNTTRLLERKHKSEAMLNLYGFVTFGGKLLVLSSMAVLVVGLGMQFRSNRNIALATAEAGNTTGSS